VVLCMFCQEYFRNAQFMQSIFSFFHWLVYLALCVFCLGEFYAEPMRPPIGQLIYLALILFCLGEFYAEPMRPPIGQLVYLKLFVFCLGEFYAEPMRPPIGQLVYLALIWTEAETGPQLKAGNSNIFLNQIKIATLPFCSFHSKMLWAVKNCLVARI
jgi:hypothetical protein